MVFYQTAKCPENKREKGRMVVKIMELKCGGKVSEGGKKRREKETPKYWCADEKETWNVRQPFFSYL